MHSSVCIFQLCGALLQLAQQRAVLLHCCQSAFTHLFIASCSSASLLTLFSCHLPLPFSVSFHFLALSHLLFQCLSLFLMFTLVLRGIQLHRNVKELRQNTMMQQKNWPVCRSGVCVKSSTIIILSYYPLSQQDTRYTLIQIYIVVSSKCALMSNSIKKLHFIGCY